MSTDSHIALRVKINPGVNNENPTEAGPVDIISQLGGIFEGVNNSIPASKFEPNTDLSGSQASSDIPCHPEIMQHPVTQPLPPAVPTFHESEHSNEESQIVEATGESPPVVSPVVTKQEPIQSPVDEVERHIQEESVKVENMSSSHQRPASPLFPGIPNAVPHQAGQCGNADCIHKLAPHNQHSYSTEISETYNLNESRAEDSTESECETESVPRTEPHPGYGDPTVFVPRLNFDSLPDNQSESGSSSARSDSFEYLKNIFGPPSPYPFINPYYLYMNPFHPPQPHVS